MRASRSTLSSAGRAVTAFIRTSFYRNLLGARAEPLRHCRGTAGAKARKASGGECVAYPFDPRRIEAIEEDNVEPAGRFLLARKVVARRGDDPHLFARIDAVSGASEVFGAPQPDFGKNNGIAIPQDKIDLAPAAAVTGFDHNQALALQIARRDLLGTIAGLHLAFISRFRAIRPRRRGTLPGSVRAGAYCPRDRRSCRSPRPG